MIDGELLERFLTKHDEAAFATLVRRHGPMVLGLCKQILRDGHAAEDAFQTTFLVLVRNAGTIRKRDSLGSWLYGVAQRTALRAKNEARRRAQTGQGEAMAATGPEFDPEHEELRPLLREEVGLLPEKYRAPIVLCYFEGQSHEEAAEQLAWPVGTVKGRLARAREMLQSRLSRRGIALSLGLVGLLGSEEASAAVPEILVESTVKAALRVVRDGIASGLAGDAGPLRRTRLITSRRLLLIGLLLTCAMAVNGFARGFGRPPAVVADSRFPAIPAPAIQPGTAAPHDHAGKPAGDCPECQHCGGAERN